MALDNTEIATHFTYSIKELSDVIVGLERTMKDLREHIESETELFNNYVATTSRRLDSLQLQIEALRQRP